MSIDPKSTYYDVGGIEVMSVIKAKLTPEQYKGYHLGCMIAYALRANHKGEFDRDIEKIGVHTKLLVAANSIKEKSEVKESKLESTCTAAVDISSPGLTWKVEKFKGDF